MAVQLTNRALDQFATYLMDWQTAAHARGQSCRIVLPFTWLPTAMLAAHELVAVANQRGLPLSLFSAPPHASPASTAVLFFERIGPDDWKRLAPNQDLVLFCFAADYFRPQIATWREQGSVYATVEMIGWPTEPRLRAFAGDEAFRQLYHKLLTALPTDSPRGAPQSPAPWRLGEAVPDLARTARADLCLCDALAAPDRGAPFDEVERLLDLAIARYAEVEYDNDFYSWTLTGLKENIRQRYGLTPVGGSEPLLPSGPSPLTLTELYLEVPE